mmetsp:Transcript_16901/g.55308  ORF Transcript_16901/g.55308 Transcript_16901/m.55308 type:complete len:248 (+) Transcript_16901:4048-4791(+)
MESFSAQSTVLSRSCSRELRMRLRSSASSKNSGLTELSSAPCAFKCVSTFSKSWHTCSAASFLLVENLVTFPGTALPLQNSIISTSRRPFDPRKSPGMLEKGPFMVDVLSQRMRLADDAADDALGLNVGRTYGRSVSSVTGPPSVSSKSRSPVLACKKGIKERRQLSVVPETGMPKRLPSSSRNSTVAVKLRGLLETKEMSTGTASLAIPIIFPSGKLTSSGRRAVSAGSLNCSSRLSYPLLTMKKR